MPWPGWHGREQTCSLQGSVSKEIAEEVFFLQARHTWCVNVLSECWINNFRDHPSKTSNLLKHSVCVSDAMHMWTLLFFFKSLIGRIRSFAFNRSDTRIQTVQILKLINLLSLAIFLFFICFPCKKFKVQVRNFFSLAYTHTYTHAFIYANDRHQRFAANKELKTHWQ